MSERKKKRLGLLFREALSALFLNWALRILPSDSDDQVILAICLEAHAREMIAREQMQRTMQ